MKLCKPIWMLLGLWLVTGCRAIDEAAELVVPHETRESKFDNGQLHERYSVRQDEKGNFLKDGLYTRFHSNGQKAEEGRFSDGALEGSWERWDENGKREVDIRFRAGLRQGPFSVFVDGRERRTGSYVNDKLEGPFKYFGLSGVVIEGSFAQDTANGVWALVEGSGERRAEATFKDGKLEGPVRSNPPDVAANDVSGCATFDGYVLGKTTWNEVVFDTFSRSSTFPEDRGVSKYSGGKMLQRSNGLEVDWLKQITLIFDESERLTAIVATAQKDMNLTAFKALRAEFSKKYRLVSEKIPFVGDTRAEYRSGECKLTLNAPHMSFEMDILLETGAFLEQLAMK